MPKKGSTTSASWTHLLYMWRVYADGQIGPRIIYSGPWIGSTLLHSFCCHTTSSESFKFFSSLQFDNKYVSIISSIYVYQQLLLDPTRDQDRSGLSCGVQLFEEAKRKLSSSHRHHAKGIGSVPQKTHINHINVVWSLFQTWWADMNTYRTSTFISLNTMNISQPIYICGGWDRSKETTYVATTYVTTCIIFADTQKRWHNKHSMYV